MAFSMAAMKASLPTSTPVARPFSAPQAQQCVRLSTFTGLSSNNRLALRTSAPTVEAPRTEGRSGCVQVFAMRHGKRVPRLGRPADQRKALLRALTTEVLRHGRITTTVPRAKAVRKYVDKMITLAKDGSLHARRQALGFVYDSEVVKALFEEAPKRYGERPGGYCRVKKEVQPRKGDNAPMAVIELV